MSGVVYFIRPVGQRGPIKIGCSQAPQNRLAQMMGWSPLDLEVVVTTPGDFDLERRIHGLFAADYRRNEWFSASDRLYALIDGLLAGRELNSLVDLSGEVVPFRPLRRKSESIRRHMSYGARLGYAYRRIHYILPGDVDGIMRRWSGCGGRFERQEPTAEELARLDEVLADPARHGVPCRKAYLPRSVSRRAA